MCGFTGILGHSSCDIDTLNRMICTLHHRGPDNQGIWCEQNIGIGLAFARLSILDLSSAGHQPMESSSGRFMVVFNGEIYNHLAIRDELNRSNHAPVWRGHSDTETLLAGFDAWGIESTLKRTIGMFAIGIWDKDNRILTLARDRMGEKPLYYGWQGNVFLFGSELKALKAHPCFKADIDRGALAEYMRYSYIPSPKTIYHGIYKLLPGTFLNLKIDDHTAFQPIPYWSLLDVIRKGLQTPAIFSDVEALTQLETKIFEAVACQQISDVPIGAFLSGGIDSSLIVAIMQAISSQSIHTYTIGFDLQNFNEANHARKVAKYLNTNHTELYVSEDETRSVIPLLPTIYDEPFADPSQIPTFLVSKLARESVTVSLSGDGGDELFGGYNRYSWVGKIQHVPFPIRKFFASSITSISPISWDRVYELVRPILPNSFQMNMTGDKAFKLASVLQMNSAIDIYKQLTSTWTNPEELVLGGQESFDIRSNWNTLADLGAIENRMMAIDSLSYLPDDILCKVDRAAMGISLETRVPFLDHRLIEYAWQLPLNMKIRNGQSKWILRQLLYKYVPKELIDRPKMGFGVPIDSWLRGPLKVWAEGLLNESRLVDEGYLNSFQVRQKWLEHLSGKRNWQYQLWNILMFQAWLAEQ